MVSLISAVWNWMAAEHDDFALTRPRASSATPRKAAARLGDALAEAETVGLPYTVDEAKPKAKHAPKPENRRRKLDPFAIAAVRL